MSNFTKGIFIFLSSCIASLVLGLVLLPPMKLESGFVLFLSLLPMAAGLFVLLHYLNKEGRKNDDKAS